MPGNWWQNAALGLLMSCAHAADGCCGTPGKLFRSVCAGHALMSMQLHPSTCPCCCCGHGYAVFQCEKQYRLNTFNVWDHKAHHAAAKKDNITWVLYESHIRYLQACRAWQHVVWPGVPRAQNKRGTLPITPCNHQQGVHCSSKPSHTKIYLIAPAAK